MNKTEKTLGIIMFVLGLGILILGLMLDIKEKKANENAKNKKEDVEVIEDIEDIENNNNSNNSNNNNSNNNSNLYNQEKENIEEFDFEYLQEKVNESFAKDQVATLETCKDIGSDGIPNFDGSTKKISNESFDVIVEKLKQAQSFESNITASFFCPEISYKIGKIFTVNVGSSLDLLVVGFNNIGYAFYYEDGSDLTAFLKSLE